MNPQNTDNFPSNECQDECKCPDNRDESVEDRTESDKYRLTKSSTIRLDYNKSKLCTKCLKPIFCKNSKDNSKKPSRKVNSPVENKIKNGTSSKVKD